MPGEPWTDNKTWQHGRVTSTSRREVGVLWLFTLVFLGSSVPVAWLVLPRELAAGNQAVLLILLFPLVGLWLAYRAVLRTLEWRRFGRLYLDLDPFPGSLGGDAGGAVELPIVYRGNGRFDVTLSCVRSHISGHGKNRSRHESVVWRGKAILSGEPGIRGTRLRFRFAVPEQLPESEPPSDDYHYWAVHLKAELPGVDLDRTFEVPVFNTDRPARSRSRLPYAAEVAAGLELPGNIVRVYRGADGLRLDYPAARTRGVGGGVLLAGLAFMGAPLSAGLPGSAAPSPVMLAGAGFFLLVFGLAGLAMSVLGAYLMGNSLQVQISGQGLVTRRRLFGLPFRARHVGTDEVTGVDHNITMQSGQGARAAVRYTIRARLRDGSSLCLGDGIKGRLLADQVLHLIRDAGRLGEPPPSRARLRKSPAADHAPQPFVRLKRSARVLGALMALAVTAGFAVAFLGLLSG